MDQVMSFYFGILAGISIYDLFLADFNKSWIKNVYSWIRKK